MKERIRGTLQIATLTLLLSLLWQSGNCLEFSIDDDKLLGSNFNEKINENHVKHRVIRNTSLNNTTNSGNTIISISNETNISGINNTTVIGANNNNITNLMYNATNVNSQNKTVISQINGTQFTDQNKAVISQINGTQFTDQNKTVIVSNAPNRTVINGTQITDRNKTMIGSNVTNKTVISQINGTQLTDRNKTTIGLNETNKMVIPRINGTQNKTNKTIVNINKETVNLNRTIDPNIVNNTKVSNSTKHMPTSSICVGNCSLINKTNTLLNPITAFFPNKTLFGLINNQSKSITTNITRTIPNITQWTNRTEAVGILRNASNVKIDKHFNPTRWLLKVQAPWKHVSERSAKNETEVTQVCKFEGVYAICSAEYISSDVFEKLWIQIMESEGKTGINVKAFERGHVPRVVFKNRVNSTDCQRFTNGTFHQICVKVYGYDKNQGPTRACMELGVALFNHGVASTDFGCFRFGSSVRHEDPQLGESPHPRILNKYILANNYSNFINVTVPSTAVKLSTNMMKKIMVLAVIIALIFQR